MLDLKEALTKGTKTGDSIELPENMPRRNFHDKELLLSDVKRENKLYIGNLDHRVTEYHIIKIFSPFGTIRREEYKWNKFGPRRDEPRGFAFVEFTKREEAQRAKESMNGRTAFGRRLVVRFVDELAVVEHNAEVHFKNNGLQLPNIVNISNPPVASNVHGNRSAQIAAIKKKLRLMDKEVIQNNKSVSRKIAKTPPTYSPTEPALTCRRSE